MELDIGPHLEETELEQYSMGTLPVDRIGPFEEHFMACELCQDQLLEMEAYVNAVRSVSPALRQAKRPRWDILQGRSFARRLPAWAAVAAIVAVFFAAKMWLPSPVAGPAATVLLRATRGIEGLAEATAKVSQPFSMEIDVMEIPTSPSYRLQIVTATGSVTSDGAAILQGGKIVQPLSKGLPAGKYFVRLYSGTGEMLREYALQIR